MGVVQINANLEQVVAGAEKKKEKASDFEAFLNNDHIPILAPDEQLEAFEKDDRFWDHLKDDTAIPLAWAKSRDPTYPVVGKELEILIGKLAVLKAAKLEMQRKARFSDLSLLLTEIAYLKQKGLEDDIKRAEQHLIHDKGMDWETSYQIILNSFEGGALNRKSIDGQIRSKEEGCAIKPDDSNKHRSSLIKEIKLNESEIQFQVRIDESLVTEKLRKEFPTPITYYIVGPFGSAKSVVQRKLEEWQAWLYGSLSLNGYDRLILRDQKDREKSYLRTFHSGEGMKLLEHYDRREERGRRFKRNCKIGLYMGILALPAYTALTFAYNLAKLKWGLDIGVNPVLDFGGALDQHFHWIALGFGISASERLYSLASKKMNRGESNRPEWIVKGDEQPPVIIGDEKRELILGNYLQKSNPDIPPQQRIGKPKWLSADAKSFIIEQVADLSYENQIILAQMMQEKEFPIADRQEYRTSYFPFISMGLNPHLSDKVIEPLKDRTKMGYTAVVENEISVDGETLDDVYSHFKNLMHGCDPSSKVHMASTTREIGRTKRRDRRYWAFLRDMRNDHKPFNREALETSLRISSMLAEHKDKIVIDRDTIGIHNLAFTYSALNAEEFTTKKDIINALKTFRSQEQLTLAPRLGRHYHSLQHHADPKAGVVNVLGLLPYANGKVDNEHERLMAEKNAVGYVFPIIARRLEQHEGDRSIEIVTNEDMLPHKDHYERELGLLLDNEHINTETCRVRIDISKALAADDAILSGMYLALRSVRDNQALDPSIVTLAASDHDGHLVETVRPNKRIITAYKRIGELLVHNRELVDRIDATAYKRDFSVNIRGSDSLKNMYAVMKR